MICWLVLDQNKFIARFRLSGSLSLADNESKYFYASLFLALFCSHVIIKLSSNILNSLLKNY